MARQKYSGSKYMRAAQSFGNYQKSIYEAIGSAEIGKFKAQEIEESASRKQQLLGLAGEALTTYDKFQDIKKTEGKVEDAVGRYEEMTGEQIDYSKVSLKDIISGDAKLSDYGKESFKFGEDTYTQAEMIAYGEKASTTKFDKMLGIETPKTASKGDFLESLQGSVEQMEGYNKTFEEGGISDTVRANLNPGNVQWSEGVGEKYEGASKGSAYGDESGRHHTKFETIEQGRDASRQIIEKHWEKSGGDAYKFASAYTGEDIDSEVVQNYGGQIERDLGKNTNYAVGWEGGSAERSGWQYGETRNKYSERIGRDTRKKGWEDNPWLDQSNEEFWAEQDAVEAGEKRMEEWKEEKGRLGQPEGSIFDAVGKLLSSDDPMSEDSMQNAGLLTDEGKFDDNKFVATIGGKQSTQSDIDRAMADATKRLESRKKKPSMFNFLFGK